MERGHAPVRAGRGHAHGLSSILKGAALAFLGRGEADLRALVGILIVSVLLTAVPSASALIPTQACAEGACVAPTSDAEGERLAVSGTGNARTAHGASVSIAGDASNGDDSGWSCADLPFGEIRCVAVSGLGDASNGGEGEASCGHGFIGQCYAVSGAGDATNGGDGDYSCGKGGRQCVAVSGTGAAHNGGSGRYSCVPDGNPGDALPTMFSTGRCVAVSGTGSAGNGNFCGWPQAAEDPSSCRAVVLTQLLP